MEITNYIVTTLISFTLTVAASIPFIRFLYKLNIRRISKAELDSVLPGRSIKLGTPIMGGAVIVFTIMLFSSIYLYDWEYYPMIMLLVFFGGIFGAIDEYVNTLGRTLLAIRISKSSENKAYSFLSKSGVVGLAKMAFLPLWRLFEEVLRVSGGNQKGMQNHNKFLMHVSLALMVCLYLFFGSHESILVIPWVGSFHLGIFYYILLAFLLLGFSNAFGITDGMDGLSAGTHAVSFGFYAVLAAHLGYSQIATLAFIIVGAELAFLYFNINPARMEMSDVGTLPLGMLLVIIAVLMQKEVSLLLIGGIFIVEVFSSVAQQWSVKLTGKRIFLVAPIHHHFEKLGWPETKITMRFWLISIILGFLGLLVALV